MSNNTTSITDIIRNVEFYWANVYKPHAPFGTEIFDIQIRTTDDATVKQCESLGINLKKHDEGYFFGNIKRKTVNAKGDAMEPPKVLNAAKEMMDEPIGNGSKGNVKVFSYEYKVGGKKGRTAMLTALQVVDLVPYKTATQEVDFDVETDEAAF